MKQLLLTTLAATLVGYSSACAKQHDHGSSGSSESKEHSEADMGHSHEKSSLHMGTTTMTKAHHFETVFISDGIRLYAYNAKQETISAKGIEGTATLKYKQGEPKTIALKYTEGEWVGEGNEKTQASDYLLAAVDLSKADSNSFRVELALKNLPSEGEASATFTEPFRGLVTAAYYCPMHPDVWGMTDKSKCPLCGMYTSAMRAGSAKKPAEHEGH
jgi:hypothetical protein